MDAETIAVKALQAVAGLAYYPDEAPQGAKAPYAVYTAAGGQVVDDFDNGGDELQNCRMQIAYWTPDKADSIATVKAIRRAMLAAGCKQIGAPVSTFEADTRLYGRSLDFSIWFQE